MGRVAPRVLIQKLRADAIVPRYMTAHAAGLDLSAALDRPIDIAPGQRAAIPTGLAIKLPDGYEAQVGRARGWRAITASRSLARHDRRRLRRAGDRALINHGDRPVRSARAADRGGDRSGRQAEARRGRRLPATSAAPAAPDPDRAMTARAHTDRRRRDRDLSTIRSAAARIRRVARRSDRRGARRAAAPSPDTWTTTRPSRADPARRRSSADADVPRSAPADQAGHADRAHRAARARGRRDPRVFSMKGPTSRDPGPTSAGHFRPAPIDGRGRRPQAIREAGSPRAAARSAASAPGGGATTRCGRASRSLACGISLGLARRRSGELLTRAAAVATARDTECLPGGQLVQCRGRPPMISATVDPAHRYGTTSAGSSCGSRIELARAGDGAGGSVPGTADQVAPRRRAARSARILAIRRPRGTT